VVTGLEVRRDIADSMLSRKATVQPEELLRAEEMPRAEPAPGVEEELGD
jgi:hypothetical protein